MSALQRGELAMADGTRVVFDRLAGAPPTYLYLHGLASVRAGEKSEALRRHAERRGRGFLRFDFRGHGESDGRIGHATLSELIADTLALLAGSGEAILVGSSLGGLVAAFAAAAAPAAVRGLVLLSPALGWLPRMRQRLSPDGTLRTGDGVGFAVHPRVLADAATLDEAALPSRLSMPVLIVHGLLDDVVPPPLSERLFAAIPHQHKQLWLVPDGDHRLNRQIDEVCARMDRLFG